MEDLAQHTSKLESPISTQYKEFTIWEIPPNGLGITALIALNILEGFDLKGIIIYITQLCFQALCCCLLLIV